MDSSICICGGRKNPNWDLCSGCNEIYGSRADWPEWLKFAVADGYSSARKQRIWEASVFEYFDTDASDDNSLIFFGGDHALVGGCSLPYAPHVDADDNARYRRANGIQERD